MKKLMSWLLVLCLLAFLTGCSGGTAGKLNGFLAKAEGDWCVHGNSADEMLRVSKDGTWELHGVPDDEGERAVIESGTISYEKDDDLFIFENEDYAYYCESEKDGTLVFANSRYFPAEESCDLGERFNGDWYLDGDTNQDHYTFEAGSWTFWRGSGSSEYGYLEYRGDETQELIAIDPGTGEEFAKFSIAGEEELKIDGQSYIRTESELDYYADSFFNELYTNFFYYLNGDTDSYSLYFFEDGSVDLDHPEDETVEGTFYIEEDTITITWNNMGGEMVLTIEDKGETLIDAQDNHYFLG